MQDNSNNPEHYIIPIGENAAMFLGGELVNCG
jgi:hypothetical protein